MPTLNWIGKDKVINHHQDVPFRVLDHQYGFTPDGKQEALVNSGNLIIHGDNIEALKALLPQYESKVKCVCIDPPYNTGNEGWVYNDNVSDPKMRQWLNQLVGKEGEDLTRHDKWLCMMYPRIVLLHKLLSEDGILFLFLDDNESTHCRMLLDEVFGPNNFLASVAWEKRYTRSNNAKLFYSLKDTIFVYRKSNALSLLKELRTEKADALYKNPDDDPRGPWMTSSYINPATKAKRQNLVYDILNPFTNTVVNHPTHAWKYSYEEHLKHVSTNKLWWGKQGGASFPRLKVFLSDNTSGMVPVDLWRYQDAGTTDEGSAELKAIFGSLVFDNPKPTKIIDKIIKLATVGKEAIVLDSFSGSGTTAHAVLNLNKQDGGNRKFILVEMEDYAETITAERVKRVINGYADVEGTGGSFDYYELGPPLFDTSGNLNEQVTENRIREYIWYSETRSAFNALKEDQLRNPYFLGIKEDTGYYFYYEPQQVTTLDYDFLGTIYLKAEQYVVYADNCLLSKTFLQNNNIIFKKIPGDISRL